VSAATDLRDAAERLLERSLAHREAFRAIRRRVKESRGRIGGQDEIALLWEALEDIDECAEEALRT
jgi:hypothetical protein